MAEVLEGKFTIAEDLFRRTRPIRLNLAHKHMILIACLDLEDQLIEPQADQKMMRRIENRIRAAVGRVMEKHSPRSFQALGFRLASVIFIRLQLTWPRVTGRFSI